MAAKKPALLSGGNPQIAKAYGGVTSDGASTVGFFRGAALLDIHEDDELDEKQFTAWVKKASRLRAVERASTRHAGDRAGIRRLDPALNDAISAS